MNSEDREHDSKDDAGADDEEDDTAEYGNMEEEAELDHDEIVAEAFGTVSKLRTIAKYVKNSPRAKEKLAQIGGNNINRDTITILLDVRTKWNSALDMLMSMLKWKTALVSILHYLKRIARLFRQYQRRNGYLLKASVWFSHHLNASLRTSVVRSIQLLHKRFRCYVV
jgi:hypothetical protein